MTGSAAPPPRRWEAWAQQRRVCATGRPICSRVPMTGPPQLRRRGTQGSMGPAAARFAPQVAEFAKLAPIKTSAAPPPRRWEAWASSGEVCAAGGRSAQEFRLPSWVRPSRRLRRMGPAAAGVAPQVADLLTNSITRDSQLRRRGAWAHGPSSRGWLRRRWPICSRIPVTRSAAPPSRRWDAWAQQPPGMLAPQVADLLTNQSVTELQLRRRRRWEGIGPSRDRRVLRP